MTSEVTQDAINAGWVREGWDEPTWTTKDGRTLRIADMSDNHLVNTVRMLRRNYTVKLAATVAWYATCPGPSGDMASMAFDSEFDDLMDSAWQDIAEPVFWQLAKEARRRPETRKIVDEIIGSDMRIEQTALELSLLAGREG